MMKNKQGGGKKKEKCRDEKASRICVRFNGEIFTRIENDCNLKGVIYKGAVAGDLLGKGEEIAQMRRTQEMSCETNKQNITKYEKQPESGAVFNPDRRNGFTGINKADSNQNTSNVKNDSLQNPFKDSKRRRTSSINANDKIKRQLAFENGTEEEKPQQTLFCGLQFKRKNISLRALCDGKDGLDDSRMEKENQKEPSCSSSINRQADNNTAISSPPHRTFLSQGILRDKTNSPGKKHGALNEPTSNSKNNKIVSAFFLNDVDFSKGRKKLKVSKATKKYLKLKRRNTQYNQGYTTITPRKKAILDLFTCPRAFYRHSTKERVVHFDNNPPASYHNTPENIKPILLPAMKDSPSFKWEADKECVDIIRRVDLGSDISIDDFVFRRPDHSIES